MYITIAIEYSSVKTTFITTLIIFKLKLKIIYGRNIVEVTDYV